MKPETAFCAACATLLVVVTSAVAVRMDDPVPVDAVMAERGGWPSWVLEGVRVVDGDTIAAESARLGWGIVVTATRSRAMYFRMHNVHAPELDTEAGKEIARKLENLLSAVDAVIVSEPGSDRLYDNYGRRVAEVYAVSGRKLISVNATVDRWVRELKAKNPEHVDGASAEADGLQAGAREGVPEAHHSEAGDSVHRP